MSLAPPTLVGDGVVEIDGARLCFDAAIATPTFGSEPIRDEFVAYFTDLHLAPGVREFSARIKV